VALPLGRLFCEDVPPVRGIPFDFSGTVKRKSLGGPTIGFDLGHFSTLRY